MIAPPAASAVHPASTARGRSRAPTAWPTRTALADESPSGTMNASAAILSAIWCDPDDTGIELAGQRRRGSEDANLQRHLRRGRKPQRDEAPDALQVERPGHVRLPIERVAGAPDESRRAGTHAIQVRAMRRRPRRALDAECRRAQMSVDQNPVADRVDEVGRDQREHDRPDDMHALQIAAEGGVEKQRQRTEREIAHVRSDEHANLWVQPPRVE